MTVSFFPRDLGLLIFPMVEVTVVLLSQGGLCTGLEKGWARAEPLQTLSEWPHVLADLSCWQFSLVSSHMP